MNDIQLCSPSLAGVTKMSLAISPLGRARFKDICGGRCHGRCLYGLRKRHLWRHCENDEDEYDFFEPLHRRGTIALLDLRLSVTLTAVPICSDQPTPEHCSGMFRSPRIFVPGSLGCSWGGVVALDRSAHTRAVLAEQAYWSAALRGIGAC